VRKIKRLERVFPIRCTLGMGTLSFAEEILGVFEINSVLGGVITPKEED